MYSQEFYRKTINEKYDIEIIIKDLFGVATRLVTGSEILLPRITRRQVPLSTLQIRTFPSAQPVINRR